MYANNAISTMPISSADDMGIKSPLTYVTVELEGCKQRYRAMLDSGSMVAVARTSVIPPSLCDSLGKTRLQGAFGECVNTELSTLRVRLQPPQSGVETPYLPIVFALTDALAAKDCDMLLPIHAVHKLHAYSEVNVVAAHDVDCCNVDVVNDNNDLSLIHI